MRRPKQTSPTHSDLHFDTLKVHADMDRMAQETFLQSEEDMQRMIELGAWYGGDEESSAAIVETDSEIETNYNRNEVLNTINITPVLMI